MHHLDFAVLLEILKTEPVVLVDFCVLHVNLLSLTIAVLLGHLSEYLRVPGVDNLVLVEFDKHEVLELHHLFFLLNGKFGVGIDLVVEFRQVAGLLFVVGNVLAISVVSCWSDGALDQWFVSRSTEQFLLEVAEDVVVVDNAGLASAFWNLCETHLRRSDGQEVSYFGEMLTSFVLDVFALDLAVFDHIAPEETTLTESNDVDFERVTVMGIAFEVLTGRMRLLLHGAKDLALVALNVRLVEPCFELLD